MVRQVLRRAGDALFRQLFGGYAVAIAAERHASPARPANQGPLTQLNPANGGVKRLNATTVSRPAQAAQLADELAD